MKQICNEDKAPTEFAKIDKNMYAFSLQRELEKVKIITPLTELLKQPITTPSRF